MTLKVSQNLNLTSTISRQKTIDILPLQNHQTDLTIVGEFYLKNKVNDLNNKDTCNKINIVRHQRIEKWKLLLGIYHWTILCEPIDEMQVLDDLMGSMPGNEFVGIAIDFKNRSGIIYHTRPMHDDDIVHELLHVRFPDWSEQKVNYWTDIIIDEEEVNIKNLKIV